MISNTVSAKYGQYYQRPGQTYSDQFNYAVAQAKLDNKINFRTQKIVSKTSTKFLKHPVLLCWEFEPA